MEKARLDCICRLLEITKRERHHELLLSTKNLQDLGASPFPYIVYVLPRPLPSEVVKASLFFLMDLLKSLTRGSTQAEAILEPLVRPDCPPLVVQNPKPAPYVVTKKKNKFEQAQAASEGLEEFVDWTNSTVSQSAEEREAEMSSLVARFSIRCVRELPMPRRRPHRTSRFWETSVLGRLNPMRSSKLLRS